MKFVGYSEIENTYNKKLIEQVRNYGFDDPNILYQCFTKIDGSNWQCSIDEDGKFIKGLRTHFYGDTGEFKGSEHAMIGVPKKLIEMKKHIINNAVKNTLIYEIVKGGPFILTVYGELCGGMYRHPDVPTVAGSIKIQKRVDYHPDNKWVPFDIVIRNEKLNKSYLFTTEEVKMLCDEVGLESQILKFTGTLDECLNYPNDFVDDTGHILWGLPIIENNITEGVVIKPIHPLWFGNGKRVIFKNKNEKFKERMQKAPKDPKEIIPMNELELKYFELAREFITESRLDSVFSKIGEVKEKMFGMLLGSFLKDIWNDFNKEYIEEIKKLEADLQVEEFDFSKVRKEISKECATFIRPFFIEKLPVDVE